MSFASLFMCFLGQCKCGVNKIRSTNRIVDGSDAKQGELPWQVLISMKLKKINTTTTVTPDSSLRFVGS